jgi:hypothetical protein
MAQSVLEMCYWLNVPGYLTMSVTIPSYKSRPALVHIQPPIEGSKRSGSEADHSLPTRVEFKNEWSKTFISKLYKFDYDA